MMRAMPDWSTLSHAYGPATDVPRLLAGLRSPDPSAAVDRFHAALLHQGTVYDATVAALPLLVELAVDTGNPSRAAAVELLVAVATEIADDGDYDDPDRIAAAAELRRHAAVFLALAADPDPDVRRAAIPALGVLLTDPAPIRALYPAAATTAERLLIVGAAGTLASMLPACRTEILDWFAELPADPPVELAVLVQRAALGRPVDVTEVVARLREITDVTVDGEIGPLLDDLHTYLDRAEDHLAVLTVRLRKPASPGFRIAAIRTARRLMSASLPGVVALVAEQLAVPHDGVVEEAATAIEAEYRIAEPAREPLAALVARQGPVAWAADDPAVRGAHQAAVRTLLHLGDDRARPSVETAFRSGVDTMRAVVLLDGLPSAAGLLPELRAYVRRPGAPAAAVTKLAELGGPAELPALTAALTAAADAGDPDTARAALTALAGFGPAAAPALPTIRTLTARTLTARFAERPPGTVHTAADLAPATPDAMEPLIAKTLWSIGGDPAEVLPRLLTLLDSDITHQIHTATDLLRAIGPSASAALPRLRARLADPQVWIRVPVAQALWAVGGEPEAPAAIGALIRAAASNRNAADQAVECLASMRGAGSGSLGALRATLDGARAEGEFGWIAVEPELARTARHLLDRLG